MRKSFLIVVLAALVGGCSSMVELMADWDQHGDPKKGVTFYVGGAGPIGHVGTFDVPAGMADAGYGGAIRVFSWQSMTHAGDQINVGRNREKAVELATRIKDYRRYYPDQKINVIALSAGTGVAAWALEFLPEGVHVDRVVFLGCSLSSRYDMTRALRRVSTALYTVYSPDDTILKKFVWYTGTVDRSSAEDGIAGMDGFISPSHPSPETERQYRKLHNVAYRYEFFDTGYEGGHTDSIRRVFISEYIAPALMGDDHRLFGVTTTAPWRRQSIARSTTRPTSRRGGDESLDPLRSQR